tara:strand:- start:1794 stop:2267 length:474 start_codon:yes stop_codon:yes gene_type:complete
MSKKVVVNGVTYTSISSAAKTLGVNRSTLVSRIKASNGTRPIDTSCADTSLTIMNDTFANAKDAANYFGVNLATFYSRIKAGFKGERLICTGSFKHRGKPIIVKGKSFRMIKDMLAHFDIEQTEYHRLLRIGLSQSDAVELLVYNKGIRNSPIKKAA